MSRSLGHVVVSLMMACLLGACAQRGGAASAVKTPSGTQPLTWLKNGQYAALNEHYRQLERKYESGAITDRELYGEFRELYEDDTRNALYFDRWARAFPRSYSAAVARGAYYYRMAWAARGSAFIGDTPPIRLVLMDQYLATARPILRASLQLTARPYLSTLYLLNVALLEGTPAERRHWLDAGTTLDPQNALLRIRYMVSLQPRWGGSLEEMRDFVAECEKQHASATTLATLKLDLAYEVTYAADAANPPPPPSRMLDLWQEVLREAAAAGADPPVDALAGTARAYWDLNRRADADRALAQLSNRQVDDAWTLSQMGYIYVKEQRMSAGWNVLLRAAKLGDAWSQFSVGETLYRGCADIHLAPDQRTGLEWIRRSARQGFRDAIAFLASKDPDAAHPAKPQLPSAENAI